MSSAGIIYKYYGKEVIKNMAKSIYERNLDEKTLDLVYQNMYRKIIMEVDAIDNGTMQGDDLCYGISTDIASRVASYNSPWNAPESLGYSQHTQFKKAMKICEKAFIHKLYAEIQINLPAREIIERAFHNREKFHPSKEIIWLD